LIIYIKLSTKSEKFTQQKGSFEPSGGLSA